MFSKENLEKYKELQESFMSELDKVLNLQLKITTGKGYYDGEITKVEFYGDRIDITTYESANCGCRSGEHNYYTVLEKYLYDENWAEELKKEMEEWREKERLKKEEEEIQRKIKVEEAEREQYEKLKNKFEHK